MTAATTRSNPNSLKDDRVESPAEAHEQISSETTIEQEIEAINSELSEAEATYLKAGKAALSLYILLGEKLSIAKSDPEIGGYGKWGKWIKERGIDENRDRRARRISLPENQAKLKEIASSRSVTLTDFTLTEALNLISSKQLPEAEEISFEEVRDRFAPWGEFDRNPEGSRFKYTFSRPGSTHHFRGLNEALKWRDEHCREDNRLDAIRPATEELKVSPFVPEIVSRAEAIQSDFKIGDRTTIGDKPAIVTEILETGEIGVTTLDGNADQKYLMSDGTPTTAVEIVRRDVPVQDARTVHARQVMTSALTCEHYTPEDILEAVYNCLGEVTLDPCSNAYGDAANVKAQSHFTQKDDGLSKPWGKAEDPGRVFMNSPYSMPKLDGAGGIVLNIKGQPVMESVMHLWVDKILEEFKAGRVSEAIALVKGDTSTKWHRKLRDFVRCEYAGRVVFVGNDGPATFCTHLFYLGDDIGKFWRSFAELGDIWQRIEPGMFGE
jgi:hypothetical protein